MSVDPDEMPYYTVFHLGLHCLLKGTCRNSLAYKGLNHIQECLMYEVDFITKCQVSDSELFGPLFFH